MRFLLATLLSLVFLAIPTSAKDRRPAVLVTLELSTSKAKLLDEIDVDVTVKSRTRGKLQMRPIRLATDSVAITLKDVDSGHTFRIMRIFGRFKRTATGLEIALDHERTITVARNKKLTGSFKIAAIRPGTYEVRAEYRGVVGAEQPSSSKPVKLVVAAAPDGERIVALIRTGAGTMTAELYPDRAFNTVHEFVRNAQKRFYGRRMTFFRVIVDFMAQTGDPTNTGEKHAGHMIPAEFNETKHVKGVLSMARASHRDSGGSQFFIVHGPSEHLDGAYTAFGKVIDGTKVIDSICTAEKEPNPSNPRELSKPKKPVALKLITVTVK